MDPATLTQVVTALSIIAKIIDALGVGGIIAVLLLSHVNNRRLSEMVKAYRDDHDKRFDDYQDKSDERFEAFRKLVDSILKEHSSMFREVVQFYKDNVELVKVTQKLADEHVDVISLNTRMLQKMVDRIDSNQFCPAVKERMKP